MQLLLKMEAVLFPGQYSLDEPDIVPLPYLAAFESTSTTYRAGLSEEWANIESL